MFKKLGILVVVSIFLFVFAGMVSAGVIELVEPASGESLTSGQVYMVSISIDYPSIPSNVALGKYKLYYSCKGSDFMSAEGRIWVPITYRSCASTYCPPTYPWEVNNVQTKDEPSRTCAMKVRLFDAKGGVLGSDKSGWFTITPYAGVPANIP
jgi:hypothetical protein